MTEERMTDTGALADRISAYISDAPMDGRHSDAAGANAYELLTEAMEELHTLKAEPATPAVDGEVYPSVEAMMSAVELEIHAALGQVQTVVIGRMIQKAIDAAQPDSPLRGSEITDAMVNAAAREMWNDRDARHGGDWGMRDPREICVIQTKATARAALTAAFSASPPEQPAADTQTIGQRT
jgi:hypothetical protein